MSRYFPRRSTAVTRSPVSLAATHSGGSGRVRRGSSIRAEAIRRPSMRRASRPRSVSTSGSSGTYEITSSTILRPRGGSSPIAYASSTAASASAADSSSRA